MTTRPSLCGRIARLTLRLFVLLLINTVLITSLACSSRSSAVANKNTQGDTGTDDDGFGSDTTTTPTNKTTSSKNDKLFDTDLDDEEKPAKAQLSNFNRVSSTEQSCLANGFNNYSGNSNQYNDDERYAANTSTNSNACLSPQQTGARVPLSQNTLYNAGVNTFSTMNSCLEMVLQRQPQTAQQAPRAHMAGRMALIRCYREDVVGGMRDDLPWGNEALQSFSLQDDNYRVLLQQLGNYCPNGNCNNGE